MMRSRTLACLLPCALIIALPGRDAHSDSIVSVAGSVLSSDSLPPSLGTRRVLGPDELATLPARGPRQPLVFVSGMTAVPNGTFAEQGNDLEIGIRGGRPEDVTWWVDGIPVQDASTGLRGWSLPHLAVAGLAAGLGPGGSGHARGSDGEVRVLTPDASERPRVAVELRSDALGGSWLATDRKNEDVFAGMFSGPLLPRPGSPRLLLAAETQWQADRDASHLPDPFRDALPGYRLDDGRIPQNGSSRAHLYGRLEWRPTPASELRLGGLHSEASWRDYLHSYLFDLEHTPRSTTRSTTWFATLEHGLGPGRRLELAGYRLEELRKRGDGDPFDDLSPHYLEQGPDTLVTLDGVLQTAGGYYRSPNPSINPFLPHFYLPGHVFPDYQQGSSRVHGVQAKVTSELASGHRVEAGGDFRWHTLRWFRHFYPDLLGGEFPDVFDIESYGYQLETSYRDVTIADYQDTNGDGVMDAVSYRSATVLDRARLTEGGTAPRRPRTAALFVEDLWQVSRASLKGGLRVDYVDPDARLVDPFTLQPLPSSSSWRFSPSLAVGVEAPRGLMLRLSFARTHQPTSFALGMLEPRRKTAAEVGIGGAIGPRTTADVCTFAEWTDDYVEPTRSSEVDRDPAVLAEIASQARVRGVELTGSHEIRPGTRLWGQYSLASARGDFDAESRNIAWTATSAPTVERPLDLDRRHRIAAGAELRTGADGGPKIGGARPFARSTLHLVVRAASGLPSTPTYVYDEVTLAAVAAIPRGSANSSYGPWTASLDLHAGRRVALWGVGLECFAQVTNLLDRRNAHTVYSGTGSSSTTAWLATPDGQAWRDFVMQSYGFDGESLYRLAENRPSFFETSRTVILGIRTAR